MSGFTLNIELGNAAMQTGADVASVLRRVAERIESGAVVTGPIRDANGNTVGSFIFED